MTDSFQNKGLYSLMFTDKIKQPSLKKAVLDLRILEPCSEILYLTNQEPIWNHMVTLGKTSMWFKAVALKSPGSLISLHWTTIYIQRIQQRHGIWAGSLQLLPKAGHHSSLVKVPICWSFSSKQTCYFQKTSMFSSASWKTAVGWNV